MSVKNGEKTGGRKKGTPNKSTAQIKQLAQKHGPTAIKALVEILKDVNSPGRIAAAKELLDRGYGKATQQSDVTVNGGRNIIFEMVFPDGKNQD